MKIVLLDEAQRRFEAEDRWWREHRDARELFVMEFREVLHQVASAPGIGQRYRRIWAIHNQHLPDPAVPCPQRSLFRRRQIRRSGVLKRRACDHWLCRRPVHR